MYKLLSKGFMRALTATALVAATTVPFSLQVAQAATTTSNEPLLVSLGDSVTFGYNLTDTANNTKPSQSAFPFVIGQSMHFQVSNLGIPGWTSGDLLNALQNANFMRPLGQANVITIDIGSNDLLQLAGSMGLLQQATANPTAALTLTSAQTQAFQAAIVQFGKNVTAIIAQVRQTTDAPIVLYNLYDPFPDNTGLHTVTEQFQQVENGIIAQVAAAQKNVVVADAHAAFDHQQLTDVRVAQGDVHPTVAGQTALAQAGETAIQPFVSSLSKAANADESVALSVQAVGTTGGTFSGVLNASQFTLSIPSGALNKGSEIDVTSQAVANLGNLVPNNENALVEVGLNLMSNATLSSPYTLTLANANIPANAAVYQVTNGKLVPVTAAIVTAGKAVIPASIATDFVVIAPRKAVVVGGTTPVTGVPLATEGGIAVVLVLLGSSLMMVTRRKQALK